MRQFFRVYSDRTIWQKPSAKFRTDFKNAVSISPRPSSESQTFTLGWSHYLVLMLLAKLDPLPEIKKDLTEKMQPKIKIDA